MTIPAMIFILVLFFVVLVWDGIANPKGGKP